jgi:hypothetical protein
MPSESIPKRLQLCERKVSSRTDNQDTSMDMAMEEVTRLQIPIWSLPNGYTEPAKVK